MRNMTGSNGGQNIKYTTIDLIWNTMRNRSVIIIIPRISEIFFYSIIDPLDYPKHISVQY